MNTYGIALVVLLSMKIISGMILTDVIFNTIYMNKRRFLYFCIASILFIGKIMAIENTQERTLLFGMGDDGARFYRIPALVTAADGSLIAIADRRWDKINDLPSRIDIVIKRSLDNGKTWSQAIPIADKVSAGGYGDPAIVLNHNTGELICIFASDNGLWQSGPDNYMRINISKSKDNGITWSKPKDITSQIYGKDCESVERKQWFGAFAASGRALQLRNGRLMFVIAARLTKEWGGPLCNYACYSDDGGETWQVSENAADTDGDEAKVIELENGNILMSIRNRQKGFRKFSISKDQGVTWGAPYLQKDIKDPACNGDIIRYSLIDSGELKNCILHSIPYDDNIRQNVSVLLSYDEGQSWPVRKTISKGLSAYSSLTILPDNSIGIIVEEGKWDDNLPGDDGFNLWFIRFTLDHMSNVNESVNQNGPGVN